MDDRSLQLLLGTIANQQYMFYVLTKILIEKGVLTSGEILARSDQKENFAFGHDLLEQLVSNGLKISSNPPSALQKEPLTSPQQEATGAIDRESQKNS